MRWSPFFLAALLITAPAWGERLKDIATFSGVRPNQLIGYGLVTGLDRTGDQTTQAPFTTQSLRNMLQQFGITIPPGMFIRLRNVAAVSVHGEMPPFAEPGQQIDVTVSSIANAQSLRGGSLLLTPLRGADGQVYAMAQGDVVVGGVAAQGQAARVSVGSPNAGRIPGGATVERPVGSPFAAGGPLILTLKEANFSTVEKVSRAINDNFGTGTAYPLNANAIRIRAPQDPALRVTLAARIESLEVSPEDAPAKVVINARTGTIVMGQRVKVFPAAVQHGTLSITVTETPQAAVPLIGPPAILPRTQIGVQQPKGGMFVFGPGTTLDDIVHAVNSVGATPDDLISILQALKEAGALRAELEVI